MCRSPAFVPLVALPLLAAAWACGGKEASQDDGTSASTAGASRGEGQGSDEPESGEGAPGAAASPSGPAASECVAGMQGTSSGGGGADGSYFCSSTKEFSCAGEARKITCECSGQNGQWNPGTCSCDGLTFVFDCASGCSPSSEAYARCGLPSPPPPSGGGGFSSSGG